MSEAGSNSLNEIQVEEENQAEENKDLEDFFENEFGNKKKEEEKQSQVKIDLLDTNDEDQDDLKINNDDDEEEKAVKQNAFRS